MSKDMRVGFQYFQKEAVGENDSFLSIIDEYALVQCLQNAFHFIHPFVGRVFQRILPGERRPF